MSQAAFNFNSLQAYKACKPFISQTCQHILTVLSVKPMTIEEVAQAMGKKDNQISGRFKPMTDAGWIKKVGTKKTRTGCVADIFAPVNPRVAQ